MSEVGGSSFIDKLLLLVYYYSYYIPYTIFYSRGQVDINIRD